MAEEIKQEELQQVLEQNEVVIVDAWAPWCLPCKMMGKVLEEYQTDRPEYKIVKINVDENDKFAREYGILAIPTILIFKKGKLVGRIIGFKDKEDLDREIQQVLENEGEK